MKMKTIKKLALLSAVALLSTGFIACSSEEEAPVNPTFNGSTVKTDVAFNVSQGIGTRMDTDHAQGANDGTDFRGMQDMYLFPFDGVPGTVTSINADKNFPLISLTNTEISASQSSKIYSLSLPIGTDNFLFYGKAAVSGTNFENGKLTSSITTSTTAIGDITFSLNAIQTGLGDDATNLAAYLTAVAGATGWAGTVTTASTDGAYEALAQLYKNFTDVKAGEARSGSVESIKRMMLDLYRSAKSIHKTSSVSAVQTIAAAIYTAIETATSGITVDVDDATDATHPENWTITLSGANATFPANLGLPMGAAQLACSSGTFSYVTNPQYAAGAHAATVGLSDIMYPAELIYFCNSPLRASDKYMTTSDYAVTTTNWDLATFWSGKGWGSDTEVKPSTRAVAMTNNINYGVSLLKSNVKLGASSLKDNRAAILGGAATDQTDISGTGMKVTGILIGGQPANVAWNMCHTSDTYFNNVIYDNAVTFKTTNLSTIASADNYTIVLDNYTTAGTQNDVLIALEVLNGNKDFYGKHNLIPANSTFYLVGKLAVASPTTDYTPLTRETTYRVTNESTKRIFPQDYMTVANITISDDALQDAYSSIPDLTSGQVTFGLSIDLHWETGFVFNVEI